MTLIERRLLAGWVALLVFMPIIWMDAAEALWALTAVGLVIWAVVQAGQFAVFLIGKQRK